MLNVNRRMLNLVSRRFNGAAPSASTQHGGDMKFSPLLFCAGIVCAVFAMSAASQAAAPAAREISEECYANALQLSRCVARLADQAEAQLIDLRDKVEAELLPEQREPFVTAENAWTNFRREICKFDAASAGGSSAAVRYSECVLWHTQRRVAALEAYLKCITAGGCNNDPRLYLLDPPASSAGATGKKPTR